MFHTDHGPRSERVLRPEPAGENISREVFTDMSHLGLDGPDLLRRVLTGPLHGQVASVSSFGADSALLLALIAEIDRTVPILFLQTGRHFPETLAFRAELTDRLGLTDVRDLIPADSEASAEDPSDDLWFHDPDACCALRKVRPLELGLGPFRGWITGRKRHQTATRAGLAPAEFVAGRLKINPLAFWTRRRVEAEIERRNLPRHPLAAHGYRSIGCATCTRPVSSGEDDRAGRWHGSRKTECGIHLSSATRGGGSGL